MLLHRLDFLTFELILFFEEVRSQSDKKSSVKITSVLSQLLTRLRYSTYQTASIDIKT